jgi:hypothetical protein
MKSTEPETASPSITLTLINQSADTGTHDILIYEQNPASGSAPVAWLVIEDLAQGWSHRFTYSSPPQIAVADAYGNESPRFDAAAGELWQVTTTSSGETLSLAGNGTSPSEIQLVNDLPRGAVTALLYRDGRLAMRQNGVAPAQKVAFAPKPVIYIGVASNIKQGEVLDAAVLNAVNTEISLVGIAEAEIIMSGGGAGPSAKPYTFTLQNVVTG